MAKKRGRVTAVLPDGRATVIIERGDACHNCESAQFCHAIADCAKLETEVLNPLGAGVGDLVSIHLSSTTLLKGAVFLYLVPTAGLLIGAATGAGLGAALGLADTAAAILFGISGLLLGFGFCAAYSKRLAAQRKLTPAITAIIKRCHPNHSPQNSLRKNYENFM